MRFTAIAASFAASVLILAAGSPSAFADSNKHQTKPVKKAASVQPAKVTVTVNKGDTLSAIATSYQTTYQRLYDANTQINNPDLIYPGDQIRIPNPSEQIAHRDLPVNDVSAADAQAQTLRAQTAPQTQTAPQAQTAPAAAPVAVAPVVSSTPVSGCGDNQYANYIYMHESGCNTSSTSANGCFGIGQACPASKLAYCGTDYACQNEFFTSYASKYGGWEGAYNFWVSHGWW